MNRYWGRNNDEASHRFTRDDDQLLALNYENLCDGDYLGRLFVNDSGNTHKEDITTESSGTQFVDHDNDIFNSDIAEDLIVYGDTKELGRRFFRKRFYRDVGAYKHQDSISSIVNKQSIIFEHIGKLMVEKCSQSPPDVSDVVVDENEKSSSNDVLSVEHLAGRAISSTLTVLERNFHLKVRQSTLDPILSILYQALGDSSPSLSVWLPQHYSCLRALLTKGLLKGLGRISSEKNKEMSLFRMEENIKVSMNCVYGLVVLGLQANDFADLTLAVAFLVLIILRVEEWKCNYEKEIDARIAKINSSKRTTPGPEVMVVTEKADTKSAIQAKREMKRLGSNNNNKLPTKPTSSQSTSHTKPNTPGSTLLPLPKAGVLAAGEDERNDLSLVDAPTKPITIKSWEKPTKSSLIAEMELKSKIQVVKNKGDIKANLNNYITPNQQNVIVNHVTVQYNNINSNNSINISTNSNNHHDNIQTESSNQHAHGKRPANLSSAGHDPISPDKKKEIKRARDTMKNLMKIPQSVLDLLHSRCVAISRDMSKAETSKTASLGAINPRNSFSLSSSRKGKSSYVWSCGQNSYGELGLGDTALRKSFAKINALDRKNIVSIGAGNEHSVFVTNDGKLLASGYNDNGQCGVSAGLGSAQQVKLPTVIQALEGEEITRVHVYNGCEHTLAVTKDGKLFSFGYNYRGQVSVSYFSQSQCTLI